MACTSSAFHSGTSFAHTVDRRNPGTHIGRWGPSKLKSRRNSRIAKCAKRITEAAGKGSEHAACSRRTLVTTRAEPREQEIHRSMKFLADLLPPLLVSALLEKYIFARDGRGDQLHLVSFDVLLNERTKERMNQQANQPTNPANFCGLARPICLHATINHSSFGVKALADEPLGGPWHTWGEKYCSWTISSISPTCASRASTPSTSCAMVSPAREETQPVMSTRSKLNEVSRTETSVQKKHCNRHLNVAANMKFV